MRIHRLRFQAIGPFVSEVDIPFEDFAASGLFLLEGPTGSGKSTIIDAIVFALYGDLAGAKTTGFTADARLRSGLVGPEVQSFVELTFSTSRGVYRVHRSPKQDRVAGRKTKDGTGVTEDKEAARLTQLLRPDDVEGTTLKTKVAEVNIEIQDEIIGLTREQFVRVMVLPQGEFTAFLEMDTDARSDLLEKLFGAGLYSRWQDHLRRAAAAAQVEVNAARERVIDQLNQLVAHAALEVDARAIAADAETVLMLLEETESSVSEHAARASGQRDAAQARATAAEDALRAAERLLELRGRRSSLLEEQVLLDAAAPAVDLDRRRASAARRALPVLTAASELQQAELALTSASEALRAHEADAHIDGVAPGSSAQALQEFADALLERITRVQPDAECEVGLAGRGGQLDLLRGQLEAQRDAAGASRIALEAREAKVVALESERAGLLEQANGVDGLKERSRSLAEERAGFDRMQVLVSEAEAHARDLAELQGQLVEAAADMRGVAVAVISADMQDGDECPVCGSHAFVRHAVAPGAVADAEALAAAQRRRDAVRDRMVAAGLSEQRAREAVEEIRSTLSGRVEEVVEHELEEVQESLRIANAAKARTDAIDAELVTTRPQPVDYQQQHQLEAAVDVLAQRIEDDALALATDAARVTAALTEAGAPSLAAFVERLSDARGGVLARKSLVEGQGVAASAVSGAQRHLATLLEAQGFSAEDEARASALTEPKIAELEARVTEHEHAVVRVAHDLGAAELQGLDLESTPDLPALAAEYELAATDLTAATEVLTAAQQRQVNTKAAAERVRVAQAAAAAAAADVRALVRTADLANGAGDNVEGLKLRTYALQRRFEEVLEAANLRLAEIAGGRYQLQLRETKVGRQRIAGLDIEVVDSTMDAPRHTKSLSGGEKFFVSLALALGLASVVQAEQGGIAMDTLFVDEGFGSLDAERLDEVMQVLRALAAGSRVVGVVSHVAEMKERIFERITVERVGKGRSVARCSV